MENAPSYRARDTAAAYTAALWRHGRLLLTGALAFVIAAICAFLSFAVWIGFAVVVAVSMFGAQFLAWRDMRRERDEAQGKLAGVHDEIGYAFEVAGVTGEVHQDPAAGQELVLVSLTLRNNASVPIDYEVSDPVLVVNDVTAPDNYLNRGGRITAHNETNFGFPGVRVQSDEETLDDPFAYMGTITAVFRWGHPQTAQAEWHECVENSRFVSDGFGNVRRYPIKGPQSGPESEDDRP